MDLRRVLLDLVAPTTVGGALAEGLVLRHASAELGLRLIVGTRDGDVFVELDALSEGRPAAARTARFGVAYRLGDRRAPLDPGLGARVCAAVAARVSANEEAVMDALAADLGPDEGRVREVRGETLLEPAGQGDERYFTLSPYVGCLVGCPFCYAPSRLDPVRRLAGLPPAPWGSWVDVRVDAPAVLARELATLPPWPIKLCPIVSDPYQAVEARHRVTRACLEVLRTHAPDRLVLVLTRSPSIVEDAELLAAMPNAWAGVSIPTVDDDVRRRLEPRAASIDARLATLDALASAGVRTFAIVQPMFPGSAVALAEALAPRVRSARLDVLYGAYGATPLLVGDLASVADPAWQEAQRSAVAEALRTRGVALWPRELPAEASVTPPAGAGAG